MHDLQQQRLVELEDAVAVTKDREGKVHLDQPVPLVSGGATTGALGGGLFGTLIGLIFLAPLLGLVLGAVLGGVDGAIGGKLSDYGVDDRLMERLASEFQPGTSALFVLVRESTPDRVMEEMQKYGGTVLQTSLTREQEDALDKALSER